MYKHLDTAKHNFAMKRQLLNVLHTYLAPGAREQL